MEIDPISIIEGKVWEAGTGTIVFSIPKKIRDFYNVEVNDMLTMAIIKHLPSRERKIDRLREEEKSEREDARDYIRELKLLANDKNKGKGEQNGNKTSETDGNRKSYRIS